MTEIGYCETCLFAQESKHDFSVYCPRIKDGLRIDVEDLSGRPIDARVIIHPYKDFKCSRYEPRPVRQCHNCIYWTRTIPYEVPGGSTWHRCASWSKSGEILFTPGHHTCDRWRDK